MTVPTPKPFDEKGELEQVNVLYSFLENRFAKKVREGLESVHIEKADASAVSVVRSYDETNLKPYTL